MEIKNGYLYVALAFVIGAVLGTFGLILAGIGIVLYLLLKNNEAKQDEEKKVNEKKYYDHFDEIVKKGERER